MRDKIKYLIKQEMQKYIFFFNVKRLFTNKIIYLAFNKFIISQIGNKFRIIPVLNDAKNLS